MRKWKLWEKSENFGENTEFSKEIQKFKEKVAKIHQKRRNFENIQDLFSKRDLSASPIDGLTQINIVLRTTRRHQTIHRFS